MASTFTGHYSTVNALQDQLAYQIPQQSMSPLPAHMQAPYSLGGGFAPSHQRVMMAFQPQHVMYAMPPTGMPSALGGMNVGLAADMNSFSRSYHSLGPPPNQLPQHQTVLLDTESRAIATQRRNTTTGHSMTSNMNTPNQFQGIYSPSSAYQLYPDSFAVATPSASGSANNATGFSDNSQYLRFLPAISDASVFDLHGNPVQIGLTGHMSGQFSLSPTGPSSSGTNENNDFDELHDSSKKLPMVSPDKQTAKDQVSPNASPTSSDSAQHSPQLELTFYRRNLFQVSCTVANARNAMFASSSSEQRSRIITLFVEVSLSGTDESKKPKLLYTPPKPDALKNKQEPEPKPLYPKDSAQIDVVDWKRLQFNSATLHNGRRRLQNYFTLTVAVIAELDNRRRVRLVYANSHPIVVRGRNPRFYSNRQTIAISDVAAGASLLSHNSTLDVNTMQNRQKTGSDKMSPDEEDVGSSLAKSSSNKKIKTEEEEDDDDEDADSDEDDSYEYYNMPDAYYQAPVDVVYRPHAINHNGNSSLRVMMPGGIEQSMKRAHASVA